MRSGLAKGIALHMLLGLAATWAVAWGATLFWKPDAGCGPAYVEPVPPYRMVTMHRLPGTIASEVQLWADESVVESIHQGELSRVQLRQLPGIIRAGAYPPNGIEKGVGGLAVECRGWPRYALYCRLAPHYPFGSAQESAFGAIAASDPGDSLYEAILLPYLPYWPGLIADTLFFAAVFAGVHQLGGVGSRWRRRRRGACAACGYDLSGITGPCPERGKEREA